MTTVQPPPETQRFYSRPEGLLGPIVMVLKPATAIEKGVVALGYSYALPVFGRLFDLQQVLRRYHLVLEPSWSGYCNPDVLFYRGLDEAVFVQAYEPRDREFIDGLQSNLVSVPTSSNWWVDHRVFTPLAGVTKDIDVIMIAAWAPYKRHAQFFAALRTLRRRGVRPKVVLVGYALGLGVADLRGVAAHYGVDDQIEWHEGLPQSEVNALLNRLKVNVIWSRKEGVNRAIVEGMFAGVPCIVHEGFNYGFKYPYINEETGCFADEDALPDSLEWMMERHHQFDPRRWVMAHMSCQEATSILERTIRQHSQGLWRTPLAVKVNTLDGMRYWDESDAASFAEDYRFLRSTVRTPGRSVAAMAPAGDSVVAAGDAVSDSQLAGISRVWARVRRRRTAVRPTLVKTTVPSLRLSALFALGTTGAFEYLLFDSRAARLIISAGLSAVAVAAFLAGWFGKATDLVMTLDRGAFPGPLPRVPLRRALAAQQPQDAAWLRRLRTVAISRCRDHLTTVPPPPETQRFYSRPEALLGPIAMVLKPATANEKGVVALKYSYALPVFGRLFDLEQVLPRYHLVLEPSWSGYCNPDVLCYRGVAEAVFVQTAEPRDREFIDGLQSNLVSVPTSSNWWVDHRVFTPLAGVTKDIDVIMIAAWAPYKRHAQFFAVLRTLRRRGVRPRVVLVGYAAGFTVADLRGVAAHYGVDDQIEWHEGLPQSGVNALLNRSKVNVIWSRKEGGNRAIVEGMFAGVPCIVREGFNYGFKYPYVNKQTGCFADEDELPDSLAWMVEHHHRFDPRRWVMAHMSCQEATSILERTIRQHTQGPWRTPLAVKVNTLDGMRYWDEGDAASFAEDYRFLRSTVRVPGMRA